MEPTQKITRDPKIRPEILIKKTTLKKHFCRKDNLILLEIEALKLKNLKWEKSKEGETFPHLYSFLDIEDVKRTHKIFLLKNGIHSII